MSKENSIFLRQEVILDRDLRRIFLRRSLIPFSVQKARSGGLTRYKDLQDESLVLPAVTISVRSSQAQSLNNVHSRPDSRYTGFKELTKLIGATLKLS